MFKKVTASILGATGYTGIELLRLLVNHPYVELKHLVSQTFSGRKISDVWPHLKNVCDLLLVAPDIKQIAAQSEVVFLALPHHETQKIVPDLIGKTKIIDLSADFRLKDQNMYTKYYGHAHAYAEGLSQFVYGLTEFNKEQIAASWNIANPGCFAIVSQLALLPLRKLIQNVSIFAVTGSSGSGKNLKEETHHPTRDHNISSYKIGVHQHIPEIIQTLGISESQITFVPTSGPFARGIHLTAFVDVQQSFPQEEITDLFEKTFEKTPFVRFKKNVQLAHVIGSNFCDIAIHFAGGKLVVQAVIDNLVKGASGNAIQNMNIMCGFDETVGLNTISPIFP